MLYDLKTLYLINMRSGKTRMSFFQKPFKMCDINLEIRKI